MVQEASFGIIPLRKVSGIWQVLLVQLHAGHWGFPKGHANPNESPIQTATREMQEETNLKIVKMLSDTSFQESYHFKAKGKLIDKTVTYFIAEVEGDVVLQSIEVAASKWVPLDEAEKHITFPEAKNVCRKVLEIMKK